MKKARMTILDIRMVVEEIEAWEKRERGRRLTWAILERIFPFTRQTMYSKAEVRKAYKDAHLALKLGKKEATKHLLRYESDLDIQKLKNRIKELELQIEEWQKLWISLKIK